MQAGNYKIDDLLAAMQKASDQAERAGKIIRRMRDMVKKGGPNRQPSALEARTTGVVASRQWEALALFTVSH